MSDDRDVIHISELKPDDPNPRLHTPRNIGMIADALQEVGAARSIVIDENGRILAGNGTVEAAGQIDMTKVRIVDASGNEIIAVRRSGLTEEQKRRLSLYDNRTAELADWNLKVLGPLRDTDILDKLWSDEELVKLLGAPTNLADPEPRINEAEELQKKWQTQLGQIWELGDHRLMCGDCRNKETLSGILNGDKPSIFTDPPYGISVVSGTGTGKVGGGGATHFGKIGGGNWVDSHTYAEIVGDETTESAKRFIECCREIGLSEFIIWGGNYFTDFLKPSRCWIVWDKQNTGNFADVELAWTSFDEGARLYSWLWNGLSREGNRAEELKSRVHPTQKPVGLFKKIMEDFPSKAYLDGFLGSGSTLIACEQLKRKCYALEISPDYVAVSIQRWVDLTGKEPKLLA